MDVVARTNTSAPRLVFGTANRKKAAELIDLLAPTGFECLTLADFANAPDVEESGSTFAENAALKATRQAMHTQCWVLADDSGLLVDALAGAPGLFSARYAGPAATDQDNRRKLLEELADVPRNRRTAHFVCHLALANPAGAVRATAVGRCQGRILFEESGQGGFGYDPLFEIAEYHHTFAELTSAKSCLSHRARAVFAIVPALLALVESGEWVARG